MNLLDLQQNVPAKGGGDFHHHVCQNAHADPAILGVADRLSHLRAPVGIVINPVKHPDRDAKLEKCDQDFFHSPKRSFQISTERRIASAVLFGLISQTNKQFVGRSGTSFSKFTSPVNGGCDLSQAKCSPARGSQTRADRSSAAIRRDR